MDTLPLPSVLDNSRNILIAGAGGGYDVFAGIPLYEALHAKGKSVSLANLSFTFLRGTSTPPIAPNLYRIDAKTNASSPYFPEGVLTRFFAKYGIDICVYAFEKSGVQPIQAAYEYLVDTNGYDTIILVDGGTDILMRGDEIGLGTPEEDMVSLAAVSQLDNVKTRLVYCLGFGIDAYHGVCHAHFLENVAALSQSGAFLGTTSLLPNMPEAKRYLDAVIFSEQAMAFHPSIVNTSIASAIEGHFGNYHKTIRTRSSELFINPLMSMYWAFDLPGVATKNLYLKNLVPTHTIQEVQWVIEMFRSDLPIRKRRRIPH